MLIIPFTEKNADTVFSAASKALKNRGIIAYPTESFYALGVLATDEQAVKKLYDLKQRPGDKPLPVIVGDLDTLATLVKDMPSAAGPLIERYWPGPLTLILEAKDNVPQLITCGRRKVAVRVPGESIALRLAKMLKVPITSTSANLSGVPPAEEAGDIVRYFGEGIDLIIDGGKTPGGKPSTIIDVTVQPPVVLREGRVNVHGTTSKNS